jgi:arylsulfatase A-like enzyme
MTRPNVVLVVCDDMGYSDVGCYGGEIDTPAIDALARAGVRLSQFYNTARCSPSRASLLTGLHPHQTGVGVLAQGIDDRPHGYAGHLNERCVTVAEVLRSNGYTTALTGKWHLARDPYTPDDTWPTRRGFDHFYGTLVGAGSYFEPRTLTRGEDNVERETHEEGFYYTDAITDEACAFVQQAQQPFFLYVAYTAPHWPLHAHSDDIAKYDGVFADGWDALRDRRLRRLTDLGLLDEPAALSPRDARVPPWPEASDSAWEQLRMQAYSAQIDRMDQGISRIVAALPAREDTLVVFLSDNGASDEELPKPGFERRTDVLPAHIRNVGNTPAVVPGAADTYASYGVGWANLSNAPFRLYKRWVHEGGIATPFVVFWPSGLPAGAVAHTQFQLTDVLPTILEATGAAYPRDAPELPGRSMLAALRGETVDERPLYWEHTGNAAIRLGEWKLVRSFGADWELYAMHDDRVELHDVAADHPLVVRELAEEWERWTERADVIPWNRIVEHYRGRGQTEEDAWM